MTAETVSGEWRMYDIPEKLYRSLQEEMSEMNVPKLNLSVITTCEEAMRVFNNEPVLTLDLETAGDGPSDGLSPWRGWIAVIAIHGPVSGKTAVLHRPNMPGGQYPIEFIKWLSQPLPDDSLKEYITHNGANFDIPFLYVLGMDVFGVKWWDTLILEQVSVVSGRKNIKYSLKETSRRRLGRSVKKEINHETWKNKILTQEQIDYVIADVKTLHKIRDQQVKICRSDEKEYDDDTGNRKYPVTRYDAMMLEMKLMPTIIRMTCNGMPIQPELLKEFVVEEKLKAQEQYEFISSRLGDINLSSPAQLKRALTDYGIAVPNTQAQTIIDLSYMHQGTEIGDICRAITIYKHANQRVNMFSKDWYTPWGKQYITWHPEHNMWFVHPRFRQLGTDTGRFCVTSDTIIECPRNMRTHPEGIPISEIQPGQLVYSFTWDKRFCLRPVKWVGVTGRRKVIKLTIESKWRGDTKTLRITPDHLVRTWRGEWVPAGLLRPGQKLMSMPRRRPTSDGEYVIFGASAERYGIRTQTQGKLYEHRWVYAQTNNLSRIPAHHDVHHIDGDTFNNEPSNLALYTKSRHMSMHKQGEAPGRRKNGWEDVNNSGVTQTGTGYTIVSIEDAGEEDVWDLEIEDTHTFIGAGIALHNSSSEPNLQQIPKTKNEALGETGMRHIFGHWPGHKVVAVDYSQIEVRVAALLSRDSNLIQAVELSDIHSFVASQIFGITQAQMDAGYFNTREGKRQRQAAKAATFTLIFGGSPTGIQSYAKQFGVNMPLNEAEHVHDKFFELFPRMGLLKDTAYELARKRSHTLKLVTGLRRNLVKVKYGDEHDPRDGDPLTPQRILNTMVQSTAAAGLKYGLLELQSIPYRDGFLADTLAGVIHDEVVSVVPDGDAEWVAEQIRDCMIRGFYKCVRTKVVPIDAEATIGYTWAG